MRSWISRHAHGLPANRCDRNRKRNGATHRHPKGCTMISSTPPNSIAPTRPTALLFRDNVNRGTLPADGDAAPRKASDCPRWIIGAVRLRIGQSGVAETRTIDSRQDAGHHGPGEVGGVNQHTAERHRVRRTGGLGRPGRGRCRRCWPAARHRRSSIRRGSAPLRRPTHRCAASQWSRRTRTGRAVRRQGRRCSREGRAHRWPRPRRPAGTWCPVSRSTESRWLVSRSAIVYSEASGLHSGSVRPPASSIPAARSAFRVVRRDHVVVGVNSQHRCPSC